MPDRTAVRRAAVLGHPIEHSLSPVLHRTAYAALGLDWTYDRADVTGATLPAFLDSLDASWVGLSLTMPLKHDVLPLLHEIDDIARATGAVNTVLLDGGRRRGTNTDVAGLVAALDERGAGRGPSVVLGAGATARSAVAALARRGTTGITAYVRRPEAAADLVTTAEAVGVAVDVKPWDEARHGLEADVVVSTVVAGAADVLVDAVPDPPGTLLDVVYDPWPTALAAAWSARGGVVASGLDLLLHQAVRQVRLMTGRDAPVDLMRAALQAAADSR
jgi:shikimate dehydrogenase